MAERTITDDLEYLIGHTVDPAKADYAVVTGVQVHTLQAAAGDHVVWLVSGARMLMLTNARTKPEFLYVTPSPWTAL